MTHKNKYSVDQLVALFKGQQWDKIVKNAEGFKRAHSDHIDVLTMLAVTFAKNKQLDKAKGLFEQVTTIAPKLPSAWNNLANAQRDLGFIKDSQRSYEKALALAPQYPEAMNGYANVLMDLGQIDQSVEIYEGLLALNPDHPEGRINLAQAYTAQGQFDRAKQQYVDVLKKHPRHADAHQRFSRLHRYQQGDDHIKAMQSVLAMPNPSVKEAVLVNHGLGKAYADLKNYSKAFGHWQAANKAFKDTINYDFKDDQDVFDRLHQWAGAMPMIGAVGSLKRQPIFILGMPRSGTSLVEQILSGHNQVYAAGELDALGLVIRKNALSMPRLTKAGLKTIRDYYISEINTLPTDRPLITDKMPLNFKWISVIRAIFPEAPILHLKRHPMAVCFSNFRYFFQSHGMRYSNDLMDIGRYYFAYDQLMQRHMADHGDAITTIDYEALTQNPTQHIENLLKTLGLEWQDACLNIEKNKRSVKTVSNVQIRSSIYTKSSEEWQNYEDQLKPLKEMLMPILERGGWL